MNEDIVLKFCVSPCIAPLYKLSSQNTIKNWLVTTNGYNIKI